MGRPPSNGGPSFRFNPTEVAEMEVILDAHNTQVPAREVLVALAEKFSDSAERSGNAVQMKQVWSWFQNRRYALRAKAGKAPGKLSVSMPQNDSITARIIPQAPQLLSSSTATLMNMPQATNPIPASMATDRNASQMEFEARSARDGAWYDVASFRSQRSLEAGDLEVLVCFAGFEPDEDEWVNVCRNVRQRSLPCEPSECVAVLPGDLVLCFQEAKDQALYFDAHVLDAQRRRHDVRGCRCRFLVRYDHDQYEEIVPLKKVCRRPETDYRLRQLNAESAKVNLQRTGADIQTGNTLRVYPPVKTEQNQIKVEEGTDGGVAITTLSQANNQLKSGTDSRAGQSVMVDPHAETTQMQPIAKTHADTRTFVTPVTQTGLPVSTDSVVWPAKTSETNVACRANFSATREPNVLPLKTPVSGANGGNNVPASIETIVSPPQTVDSGIVTDVGISNHPPSNAAAIGGAATSSVTTSSGEHISFKA